MVEVILPYRTDWREMYRVLDYCKGKGASRAVLDSRFGGGEALRETLNALDELRLIERRESGDVVLTPAGDDLVYAATEQEQRVQLVTAMLGYLPYRVPLERALDERLTLLDAPFVERIWQVEMRLSQPRNRVEEARTFFFRLADDAGLGEYRRGVRGQTTRLELGSGALATIERTLLALGETPPTKAPEIDESATGAEHPAAGDVDLSKAERLTARGTVNLSVQVDMSDWDLEKIEAFLTLIGYLDDRPD